MIPIVKKSLSQQIYEDLKQRILTREIGFGEKLTNRDLVARYGVSSTPVRDAIYHLHRDGLVDHPTRAGARVITFDLKLALEINEVLSLLSVSAVRLSARRADLAAVGLRLKDILHMQEENVDNDNYYDYDREFHSTFFDYSLNEQLKSVYMRYQVLHEMLVRYYHKVQDTRRPALEEHRLVYEAYSHGDVDLACFRMGKHYEAAESVLATVLE